MVGLRLWQVEAGRYQNTKTAEKWLLSSSPEYVGDEHPGLYRAWLPMFSRTTELVKSGSAAHPPDSPEMFDLWARLTPMLARKGMPVVHDAIAMEGLESGTRRVLDIGGGGRALYSKAILGKNPSARTTQADWPHINREARKAIEAAGFGERFETLDGDFHDTDFGEARYDVVIISHIVHQETPESNREILKRVARALKPRGSVVISDWVVADGRDGPASSLLFSLTMLLISEGGKAYERQEITRMLVDSGFDEPTFKQSSDWATLAVATRR
jgi:SAM-dependent methyltransferase